MGISSPHGSMIVLLLVINDQYQHLFSSLQVPSMVFMRGNEGVILMVLYSIDIHLMELVNLIIN
jgi:hypothetical protein